MIHDQEPGGDTPCFYAYCSCGVCGPLRSLRAEAVADDESHRSVCSTPSAAARMLAEFHRVFAHPDTDALWLRPTLHDEEHAELIEALEAGEPQQVARELADVLYIAYGTAHVYGIDLDSALAEVHRANMSKLGEDGKPIRRNDGKVLKGPRFVAPDMATAMKRRAA